MISTSFGSRLAPSFFAGASGLAATDTRESVMKECGDEWKVR